MARLAGISSEGRGRLRPIGAILRRLSREKAIGNFRSRRRVLLVFVGRFDALIAIIDYSGSCSPGRVLVDRHEVGHQPRALPLATLQGCQEEKLARQGNRQGVIQ
jgi:hypothetical protein